MGSWGSSAVRMEADPLCQCGCVPSIPAWTRPSDTQPSSLLSASPCCASYLHCGCPSPPPHGWEGAGTQCFWSEGEKPSMATA